MPNFKEFIKGFEEKPEAEQPKTPEVKVEQPKPQPKQQPLFDDIETPEQKYSKGYAPNMTYGQAQKAYQEGKISHNELMRVWHQGGYAKKIQEQAEKHAEEYLKKKRMRPGSDPVTTPKEQLNVHQPKEAPNPKEEPLFDERLLSTKKGLEEAKNFLDAKGVKDIYTISGEQFDALADEAAKKYGISRGLAKGFLVAPYEYDPYKYEPDLQPKEEPKPQPKQKPSASSSLYKGVDIVSTPGGHFINDEKNSIQYSFETIDKAKEYIDNAEKAKGGMFDQYGLVTDKGKAASDEFKREKGIKNYYSLSNDQFNALAKEAMQKYGIKDFEKAQEFLISNSQDDEDFNKLLEIRRKPKQGSFEQAFGGTSEVEDEKETQPDGYYKDDNGEIYMMKGGKDYYPVGEEERTDFFRAFNNQNKEKAKEMANDPETARSFERIYADLDKGFEETYKRKPTQEEKDAIRDIARLQTALVAMARKK